MANKGDISKWQKRGHFYLALTNRMAKYLLRFYRSHDIPFKLKVITLHSLTGSTDTLAGFRSSLRKNLQLLERKKMIVKGDIDKDRDVVIVRKKRKKEPTQDTELVCPMEIVDNFENQSYEIEEFEMEEAAQ